MIVRPDVSRIQIEDAVRELRITIPARREGSKIAFLCLWMLMWVGGGSVFLISSFSAPASAKGLWFTVSFAIGWFLGSAAALYVLAWMTKGLEIVAGTGSLLSVKRDLLGFGANKEYLIERIRNIRVCALPQNPQDPSSAMAYWGIGGGLIAFDYGSNTVRFGAGLTETEARDLVAVLKAKLALRD